MFYNFNSDSHIFQMESIYNTKNILSVNKDISVEDTKVSKILKNADISVCWNMYLKYRNMYLDIYLLKIKISIRNANVF